MTGITRLAVLAYVAVASASLLTQERAQQPEADWQRMYAMGVEHGTPWELYQALKQAANGGQVSPPFNQLPDWSGLWTTAGGGSFWGGGPGGVSPRLTPEATAALELGAELNAQGVSYDENLSQCGPPGFPRWLVIPFLREFIVRPEQTWLSSETVNNVRRVYTDGRGHPPEEETFPLYYGDSIGFWDRQKLVIHTNQLMARSMGRNQPEQSEQMETLEIWQNADAETIVVDAWIYDPALHLEPWYLQRRYTQVPNPDTSLRMNYWHCGENANNEVFKTPDGNTQYRDFTFTGDDDRTPEPSR